MASPEATSDCAWKLGKLHLSVVQLHFIYRMFIEFNIGTVVKVLEVLLWGRTASQPQLAHAASVAAEKPA